MPLILKPDAGVSDETDNKAGRPGTKRRPAKLITKFARVEGGLGRAGIFRQRDSRSGKEPSTPSSGYARLSGTSIEIQHAGRRLEIISAHSLDSSDLAIFLAICACAGVVHSVNRKAEPARRRESRAPERLLQGDLLGQLESEVAAARLRATGDAWARGRYLTARTTAHTLLHEAGIASKNGAAYDRVADTLKRLHAVTYIDHGPIMTNGRQASSGEALLSYAVSEANNGIEILLNARLTQALLAEAQYTHINMDEVRELRGGARILLVGLCARIGARRLSAGQQSEPIIVSTEEIIEIIYGPRVTSAERKWMKPRAVKALETIGKMANWRILQLEGGDFEVHRIRQDTVASPPPVANSVAEAPSPPGPQQPWRGNSIARRRPV